MMKGMLLVPFNGTMRLGDGYNSFLQAPCITSAVNIPEDGVRRKAIEGTNGSKQVVERSSEIVKKVSDITKRLNISAASTIKSGGNVVVGHLPILDEAKFGESELTAIVSVKVITQSTELVESVTFRPLEDVRNSKQFVEVYGDCYISGFIDGGEFNGILSVKVPDNSAKDEIERAIKSQVKSFTSEDKASFSISVLSKAETTISVAWSGGGQIKDPLEEWNLNSLFQVAADFPNRVAKCPQTTWAVLTPYTRNQSFVAWAAKKTI